MKTAESAYRQNDSDIDARNELAMREVAQVYYIAARISERLPRHVEMQDLVQAGIIGLLEACRTYDSERDAQFSTFAKFRIRGAILDSLRKLDWGSRSMRRRGREVGVTIAKLESLLGRQPTEEEIAAEMQINLDELHNLLTQLDGLYLVGQQCDTQEKSETRDLIESAPASGRENPFELCAESERSEQLEAAISNLPEREQMILSLYYREELTMKEIAEVLGIAVSRVSQLHAAAIVKLRQAVRHLDEGRAAHTAALPTGKKREVSARTPSQGIKSGSTYECVI